MARENTSANIIIGFNMRYDYICVLICRDSFRELQQNLAAAGKKLTIIVMVWIFAEYLLVAKHGTCSKINKLDKMNIIIIITADRDLRFIRFASDSILYSHGMLVNLRTLCWNW